MDQTLQVALVSSAVTFVTLMTPITVNWFRSKAKSAEARSNEDSAKAKKEELEAENQRFVLELARTNMNRDTTIMELQTQVLALTRKDHENLVTLQKQAKRIAMLEKMVVELGGTIDDPDDTYPVRNTTA